MSDQRADSGQSRDLALSLEEKTKALEKSRQHPPNENDHGLPQILAEDAKTPNESSMLLNFPTEVTCMILELATKAHRLEDPETDEKSFLPEVVMSHVCRHWREVALHYPALWTRFYFLLVNVGSGMSNTLTRFDTYIKRSTSQDLELFLDFRKVPRGSSPPLEEQFKLLDMAIKHLHRWKIVTFISDGDLDIEELFPILTVASAPNLQYFSYLPGFRKEEDVSVTHIDSSRPKLLQGGTPNLRYLLLDSSSVRIPAFVTVTTLRIESRSPGPIFKLYPWEGFLTILSLPLLTNLSIVGDIFDLQDSVPVPIIAMNSLKHLRYSNNETMTPLLAFLRAPLLETLLIHMDIITDEEESEPQFGNIDKSYFFPSLQSLTLINTPFVTSYSACRIMQLSKNIDQLTVIKTDEFFMALPTHGHFIAECWPKLSGVTMNWYYLQNDGLDSFSNFFLCRPNTITFKLWLSKELYDSDFYKSIDSVPYRLFQERCSVELLLGDETEMLLMQPLWPPGVESPNYALRDDPFENLIY